jgi:hypothetical protein
MTCYFRHLTAVFQKAGITVTAANKHKIDTIIQQLVGTENKHCPDTWKEVKKRLSQNANGFAAELKAAWNSQ